MPVTLDPLAATPRHGLPLLFAGQTQKEFFINEALMRLDSLCATMVLEQRNDPPVAGMQAGQIWLVGPQPSGAWAGFPLHLAAWSENGWRLMEPFLGQRVFDVGLACSRFYVDGDWSVPVAAPTTSGGTVIDIEARAALALIVDALVNSTLLASPQS